jgi:hypothetical protein
MQMQLKIPIHSYPFAIIGFGFISGRPPGHLVR